MNRQKLFAAALALPLLGVFLLQSPLIELFPPDVHLAGVPLEVVYIFSAWLALIAGAFFLGKLLVRSGGLPDSDTDLGEDTPP